MDCKHAAEILPWYLNGTLEALELAELEEHLAGCAACRAELAETESARLLFGGHPTAEMLVQYAFEAPEAPRDLIEAHLAGCEACAEELIMVRQSRGEMARTAAPRPAAKVVPLTRSVTPSPFWRAAAVAASVIGLLGVGGGLWGWRALDQQETAFARRESAAEERIAELENEIQGLELVRLNVPIIDLWPEGDTLRSADNGPIRLASDAGSSAIVILNSRLDPGLTLDRLELRDGEGNLVESSADGEVGPTGSITLELSVERLQPGSLRILLFAGGAAEPVESYTLVLD